VSLHLDYPTARYTKPSDAELDHQIDFNILYSDIVSISSIILDIGVVQLCLFASFARLPVSLTVSLLLFSAPALLAPPQARVLNNPTSIIDLPAPQTDFVLEL